MAECLQANVKKKTVDALKVESLEELTDLKEDSRNAVQDGNPVSQLSSYYGVKISFCSNWAAATMFTFCKKGDAPSPLLATRKES